MSKPTVILSAGHGGIIMGKPQTSGKRSPIYGYSQIIEGEFNRGIVNRLVEMCCVHKIPVLVVSDQFEDTPLHIRLARAHLHTDPKNSFLLDLHSNAGGGEGCEFYTSKGETKSDKMATILAEEFQKEFPDSRLRSDYTDGDLDKEGNFYMPRKSKMSCVLLENFFMDNEHECTTILMTKVGRDKIANYIFHGITRIIDELY